MKYIFTLIFWGICLGALSQSVSDYQYIIVPKQFDFQKTQNQYKINGLLKFLFEKQHFSPFWADSLPQEVMSNPCQSLKVNVIDQSNLFTTKVIITLTNCNGVIVFTSDQGKSREKDFTKAFNEAIRNAFQKIKTLNYQYVEKTESSQKQELQKLYAQPIENGFQLVDTTPKVVFKLQYISSLKDVYSAVSAENISGIFYKENDYYVFEYSQGQERIKQTYQVQFF